MPLGCNMRRLCPRSIVSAGSGAVVDTGPDMGMPSAGRPRSLMQLSCTILSRGQLDNLSRLGCEYDRTYEVVLHRAVFKGLTGMSAIHQSSCHVGARAAETSAYDFTVEQYEQPVSLSKFAGQVTVMLNIASA